MSPTTTIKMQDAMIEQTIELLSECRFPGIHGEPSDQLLATLKSQYPEDPDDHRNLPGVVGLIGLPAAGKTWMAEQFCELYETETVSMGDVVRKQYRDEVGREPESGGEIRDYVEQKREGTPHLIPRWTVDEITRNHQNRDVVIVDGIRTQSDLEVLETSFDSFHLIEVDAPFQTRLERIQERAREDEGDYTPYDLVDRDRQEMSWGVEYLLGSEYVDTKIVNSMSESAMESVVRNVAEENLPYTVQKEEDNTVIGTLTIAGPPNSQ
jgi:dephospho-CoA kinase